MSTPTRTRIDFSKHSLTITKTEHVLIYDLHLAGRGNYHRIQYINTRGIMAVTGDFGNWIFSREFHASADKNSGVSGGYWDEKLEISSEQKAKKYDAEETQKSINEFKSSFQDNFGREMNEEEAEWVERLEETVHDEHEYVYVAYREKPSHIDYESVPFGTKRHMWLDAVYDGFDEICDRMRIDSENDIEKKP